MKIQSSAPPAITQGNTAAPSTAVSHDTDESQQAASVLKPRAWPTPKMGPITGAVDSLIKGTAFWSKVGNEIGGPIGALFMGAVGGATSAAIGFLAGFDDIINR